MSTQAPRSYQRAAARLPESGGRLSSHRKDPERHHLHQRPPVCQGGRGGSHQLYAPQRKRAAQYHLLFVSYLKISPVKLQIKVLTRRADINRHLDTVRREMAQEKNEQCRLMQEDYLSFVQQIGAREAVTRRFFLIFEYEPWNNTRRSEQEEEAIQSLQSAVHTASNYLRQCGNEVIIPENEDEFTVDVLYNLLCRNESVIKPLALRAQEVVAQYAAKGRESEIDHIPAAEFAAPKSIDLLMGAICA